MVEHEQITPKRTNQSIHQSTNESFNPSITQHEHNKLPSCAASRSNNSWIPQLIHMNNKISAKLILTSLNLQLFNACCIFYMAILYNIQDKWQQTWNTCHESCDILPCHTLLSCLNLYSTDLRGDAKTGDGHGVITCTWNPWCRDHQRSVCFLLKCNHSGKGSTLFTHIQTCWDVVPTNILGCCPYQ